MKKLFYLLGVGAIALSSCSSEDVVNPADMGNNGAEKPIGFFVANPNMGRANDLQKESFDFGVWAYKGTAADRSDIATAGNLVMKDYLVGYNDGTVGYLPALGQLAYLSSPWMYEKFGNDDNGFTFVGNPFVQNIANASTQTNQYLKYWDGTAGVHTHFYAVAPYNATAGEGAFDPATEQLTLGPIAMALTSTTQAVTSDDDINALNDWSSNAKTMYAFNSVDNASFFKANNTVPLNFYRLGAKIRLAFYEKIDGYSVEIIPYAEDYPYLYAVPSVDDTYAKGWFTYKYDNLKLNFAGATSTADVTPVAGTGTRTQSTIVSPLVFFKNDAYQATPVMSESNASNQLLCTSFKYVVPAQGAPDANDGFTLNVSLKLTADDTHEVIYVRGARVHVPADKCQWAANTQYTYVFLVNNTVKGQPDDPGEPTPQPATDPALWPIVFNDVIVQPINDVTVSPEFPLN